MSAVRITDDQRNDFIADYHRLKDLQLLADQWGIGYQTARRALKRFGQETLHKPKSDIGTDPSLGKVPDGVVGRRHGVAKTVVARVRNRLGIPAWSPQRKGG